MCGIAGIVGCGIGEPGSLLRSMISLLSHRGPDDEGIWDGPGVVLGHRRLSILDLSSAGRQPMVSHDQRYHIIFNGEIYNYLEVRDQLSSYGYTFRTQTDTEVLLGAFERWGEDCVTRLNGMWAFAIWDGEEQRLFASRDRFGKKPFYYTVHRETFLFASEMKALLLVPGLTRTLNPEAVIDFAAERRLAHGERTWIQEIQQLPAASMLLLSHGQINIRPYWSLPLPDEEQGPTRKPRIEMISALLEDAVRVRLRADTPVGCLVSGGLDSST